MSSQFSTSMTDGSPTDGKVRPLRLTLKSRETLIAILRKARERKGSTKYCKVFLEPDRTPEERLERRRTLQTVSDLRVSHSEGRNVVRRGVIQCV